VPTAEERIPPPDLPTDGLLLYEEMAVDDPDRSGNWRFLIRSDGGFFNARNDQLFVPDDALTRPDPELFWNVPFPTEPQRRLDDDALRSLEDAIREADFPRLSERGGGSAERLVIADRWTARVEGTPHSVVVTNRRVPRELQRLRETIDGLVAAASR
jgi:hypothetical protein